ncbi:hypothetical protein CMI38_02820 [Candidatus Pacearchaeota archaeon]|jgi:hypothetical protein|nr:hypothetical protein [Candidatus Pacearchaeota archaeon]|tara:strand:- start:250 stop:1632 length:1383 start_codon:yes stop_codon:yes gene_type:complete
MKKQVILSSIVLLLITSLLPLILAINLEVSSTPIQPSVIADINEPATYELTIENLGDSDRFEIYSLVGVDITPNNFQIEFEETKKITIEIMPQPSLLSKRELPLNFIYKIRDSNNDLQEESLSIKIIGIESMITILPDEISPKSEKITITIKNNLNLEIKDLSLNFESAFFNKEQTLNLKPKENIDLELDLNKEKTKLLTSGKYLLNTKINLQNNNANVESQINFLEQENIETLKEEEGILVKRIEISKKNLGNIKKSINIRLEKNLLSYLFTTYNIPPTNTETQGLTRIYIWEKELIPNEELKIITKTNWFFPLIIILLIIIGIIIIRKSIYSDLELKKKVSFVKTKGGQFALKISIIAKATNYIEHIKITDKLPHLVKLYEKFGAIPPSNIDLKNRRLEYNIHSLSKGESRIFTYIIYSKIGVVGKFELPSAIATYEKEGKLKEVTSNRSFYINEPDN